MVIDDELRYRELAHRVGESTETLHVGYVQNYEDICLLERFRPDVACIAHIIAKEELVHLRPRRRVDDARADSHLAQQARQRRLRAAAVAIGVDMSGYCDRASRAELLRETLDRLPSLLGNA